MQKKKVCPMLGRLFDAGPFARCRASARCRAFCPVQDRLPSAGPSAQCKAVCPNARPSARRRAACSMQDRLVDAGPSTRCKAVWSMQGRLPNARPSASARRRAVSSMQGRQLNAEPSFPMQNRLPNAGPSAPMQGRLLDSGPSAQCRAVCSMQGRLLNARPSAQCKAVCSMPGCLPNAGPSAQCRAICPMRGRLLNSKPSTARRKALGRLLDAGRSGCNAFTWDQLLPPPPLPPSDACEVCSPLPFLGPKDPRLGGGCRTPPWHLNLIFPPSATARTHPNTRHPTAGGVWCYTPEDRWHPRLYAVRMDAACVSEAPRWRYNRAAMRRAGEPLPPLRYCNTLNLTILAQQGGLDRVQFQPRGPS